MHELSVAHAVVSTVVRSLPTPAPRVLQVRLRAADDRVGPLRVKLEDGSATPDEQRELADLQRTAEGLRAELRGMNVPGA